MFFKVPGRRFVRPSAAASARCLALPRAPALSPRLQLGTGRFGYVKLAEHKKSGTRVALKFFPRSQTKQADFLREYNFSRLLGCHKHVINTFDGLFQAPDGSAFYFVQEFCPQASLREAVEGSVGGGRRVWSPPPGIGEPRTKGILLAVLRAVEYMHNENLVHRNLKAENILIFDQHNFDRVKVTDFGLTRKVDSTVKHLEYVNQYHAPELCDTVVNEMCTVAKALDIWALGGCGAALTLLMLRRHLLLLPARQAPLAEGEHHVQALLGVGAVAQAQAGPAAAPLRPVHGEGAEAAEALPEPARQGPLDRQGHAALPGEGEAAQAGQGGGQARGECPARPRRAVQSLEELAEEEADLAQPARSGIHHWISSTLSTMAEISEQVVSARNR